MRLLRFRRGPTGQNENKKDPRLGLERGGKRLAQTRSMMRGQSSKNSLAERGKRNGVLKLAFF